MQLFVYLIAVSLIYLLNFTGNYSLRPLAAPLMHKVVIESSKKVPNPNPEEMASGRTTIFDTWNASFPDPVHPGLPKYHTQFYIVIIDQNESLNNEPVL